MPENCREGSPSRGSRVADFNAEMRVYGYLGIGLRHLGVNDVWIMPLYVAAISMFLSSAL